MTTRRKKLGRPIGPAAQSKTHLGRRLLALRGQRSQEEVAALVGVARSCWRRWEAGERVPSLLDLAKIVTALGATARPLLEAGLADAYASGAI